MIDPVVAKDGSIRPDARTGAQSRGESTRRAGGAVPRRLLLIAAIGALLTSALIIAVHRDSLRTHVSAHGLLHVALAQRFQDVALPTGVPENPFFAGEPVPYYWVFHYTGAKLAALFGVHPLFAFELLSIAAAWLFWFGGALLGYRLYRTVLGGAAIGWLAFAGANALGVPLLAARLTLGGQSIQADEGQYLWGVAHPVLRLLGLGDPFALHQPLLLFFFNITSRPLALGCLLLTAFALLHWLDTGKPLAWAALVFAAMACALFSPIIGLSAGASLAGGVVLAQVVQRNPGGMMRGFIAASAITLGVLLALPTFLQLFGLGSEAPVRIGFDGQRFLAVTANSAVLCILAAIAWFRADGQRRTYLLSLCAAAASLLLAATFVKLPATNESNFFHAAVLLLAIPAAGAFVPGPSWSATRARLTALGLLLFLPSTALVAFAFFDRPAVALEWQDGQLRRTPNGSALAGLYRWAASTEPDAVFIADPRPPLVAAVGNMPEFPALTGRVLFIGFESSYVVVPNRDAQLRRELAVAAVEGRPLTPEQLEYVRQLGRPVYLIVNRREPAATPASHSQFGAAVFQQAEVAAYRIR